MTKRIFPIYFILISFFTALLVVVSGLMITAIDKFFSNQIYHLDLGLGQDFYLRIMDESLPGTNYYSDNKNMISKMIETVFGATILDPISFIRNELPSFDSIKVKPSITSTPISSTPSVPSIAPTSLLPDAVPVALPIHSSHAVFVYHTHSRESWESLVEDKSSPFHDTENITLVGKHFAERLESNGIPVIYDNTDHDGILLEKGIHRSKAYDVSSQTVKNALKTYPNIEYIFDFHRDAVDRKYTTTTINGLDYAKIMFVIGKHNANWKQNYAFAEQLQRILDERYPGLARPIATYENDRSHNGKYNQKYSDHALTIEIGGMENTLQESLRTVEILADIFAEIYFDAIPVSDSQEESL